MPNDGGHLLLEPEEKAELIRNEPGSREIHTAILRRRTSYQRQGALVHMARRRFPK